MSSKIIPIFIVCVISIVLLVGKRLDMPFAGGAGLGMHAHAIFVDAHDVRGEGEETPPRGVSTSIVRGEIANTDASTFAKYSLNDTCTVALAENTSLLLADGRKTKNVFSFLTGRVLATGACTFTTRETVISTAGTVMIVYPSWKDEITVAVIDGTATVSQSGMVTRIDMDVETSRQGISMRATRFSTIPTLITQETIDFSLTESPLVAQFTAWARE